MYEKYSKEIDLISHILTSGLSSRLFSALREKKGITYTSSSYPFTYSDGGVFIIKATMHPDGLIAGLKIILAELRKLKQMSINKDELKKVKNITTNEILFSLTRPIDYLTYFGLNFLEDPEFEPDIEASIAKIRKVKADAIQKIAKEIFVKSKLNIFLYGNITETNFNFVKL